MSYRSIQFLALVTTVLAACQSVILVPDGRSTDAETDPVIDSGTTGDGCAPPGLTPLVCQDFETSLSPFETVGGEISLETVTVYAGLASMKVFVSSETSYAEMTESFDPINSGTVYFRVFVFVPIGNTEGTTKLLNLSSQDPMQTDQDIGVDINISGQRSIDIYQHGNETRFASQNYVVPEGEWFCLKGSYIISETAGATTLWLNDQLAVSTTASAESIINGGVSEFRAGIGWIGTGQTSSTVYFDNILVATVPVGCSD